MKKLLYKISAVFLPVLLLGLTGTSYRYYDGSASMLKVFMDKVRSEENYDMAFIGPSTVYSSYIPEIFDRQMGTHSVNLGSAGQLLCDSYFILKDYLNFNSSKIVVLEIEPDYFIGKNLYNRNENNSTIDTLRAIEPSFEKLIYECEMAGRRREVAASFFSYKFHPKMFFRQWYADYYTLEQAKKECNKDIFRPGDRGEMLYLHTNDNGSLGKIESIEYNPDVYVKISFDYIEKIADLCRDRNVRLVLATAGPTDAYVLTRGSWGDDHNMLARLAKRLGAEYYDFTYAKPSLWSRDADTWTDFYHLSCEGAKDFSTVFSAVLMNRNASDGFYQSYDEYLKHTDIANIWIEEGESSFYAKCFYGMDKRPLFQYWGGGKLHFAA